MWATCDFQLQKDKDGENFIKEICVFGHDEEIYPQTITFAAPNSEEDGGTPYDQLEPIMQRLTGKVTRLYVRGPEKKAFLQPIIPDVSVRNAEVLGLPEDLRVYDCVGDNAKLGLHLFLCGSGYKAVQLDRSKNFYIH